MTTAAERDARLLDMILHDDEGFHYSLEEWAAVVQAGLPDKNWLRGELEEQVSLYLLYEATKGPSGDGGPGHESQISAEQRAKSRVVARHAKALVEALGQSAFHDEELELRLTELGQVAGSYGEVWANYQWMEGYGSKSPARMRLIEMIIQLWHCATGRKMPGRSFSEDSVGPILDVAWAVTRPVLIGIDRFSDGKPGRDAMRKQIAKIRQDGFHYWRYDLESEFQLIE